ncbi:hypothetical protein QEH59_07685 [Coraliomargarita sp. SDUM461004]|uniref:Uncharacterized protein n=1 Tax=Thalassobacterium sedimentorum TaxID=3041258 RepID=A0ABU1AKN0_9BACT|nr:hypothetical protein [Coraliomargarita sp. SDUM461004]MDQ8194301.1 hypothetical protein [Coraliomargarita sp. SDUM461004]
MKKILLTLAASASAFTAAQAAIVVIDENLPGVTVDANGYYYIGQDLELTSANEYILASYTFVNDGATLTIGPGTIIRGEPGIGEGGFSGTIGAAGGEPGALIITRDGQINANGNSSSPIIFTTAVIDENNDGSPDAVNYTGAYDYTGNSIEVADFLDAAPASNPLPPYVEASVADFDFSDIDGTGDINGAGTEHQGYWGGIVILGNAPTSIGDIDVANDRIVADSKGDFPSVVNPMEGQIEGLNTALVGQNSVYGGRNPNDSSGSFTYVSIRHGGYAIGGDNELNGLTMGGVGFGTKIEYVEVYSNQDDGFEWFGGTVNTRYLVSLYNNDDSFDMDEGFTGLGQFWFSMQNDDRDSGNAAGEHDGTDAIGYSVDQFAAAPGGSTNLLGSGDSGGGLVFTFPTVYNATYVGSGLYSKDDGDDGINNVFTLRDSWGGAYFNSIFSDHGAAGILLAKDGDERWDLGDIVFRSNIWYGNADFYTASTFANTNDLDGGSGNEGANSSRVLQVFNSVGNNFSNNVFDVDPFDASNRVSGANASAYNGQIARRQWDSNFESTHGGFDPSKLSAGALSSLASTSPEPYTATYFIDPGFIGAFNPQATTLGDALWTAGWTVFDSVYYEAK